MRPSRHGYTVPEGAAVLGLSDRQMRRLCQLGPAGGGIRTSSGGGRYFVAMSDMDEFLGEREGCVPWVWWRPQRTAAGHLRRALVPAEFADLFGLRTARAQRGLAERLAGVDRVVHVPMLRVRCLIPVGAVNWESYQREVGEVSH